MTSPAPAPLRRPGVRRNAGRRFSGPRNMGLAGACLALLIGVSACSAPAPTVSSAPAGVTPAPAGTATPVPTTAPTGGTPAAAAPPAPAAASASDAAATAAASAASGAVSTALTSLVAATPQPSRDQIRASLSAAGFAPAAVEVSASRTPTGLAADAVDVGVLAGNGCVMAQVRSGTVQASVLPVLANGRCFVGSVQR